MELRAASYELRVAIPLRFAQTGRRYAPVASCEFRATSFELRVARLNPAMELEFRLFGGRPALTWSGASVGARVGGR
jgi:hypothetical protein